MKCSVFCKRYRKYAFLVGLVKFLIRDKSTHFMCVHVRRTDFFSDVLLGTDEYGKNFTNPAIEFVYEFLQV